LNLSNFVETQLEKYFSVSSIEDINDKIREHQIAVGALEAKRADLVASGVSETKDEALEEVVLDKIRELFVSRRTQDPSGVLDETWIKSPKNVERCKQLGMDPLLVLKDLRSWYDGL